MFWYLEKKENRPMAMLEEIAVSVSSGEFDKLPQEEQQKVIQTAAAWNEAQGRYFYDPNKKLYRWFLMPHWIKGIRGGNQSGKTSGCVMDVVMQCEGWHPLQQENMERIIEETFDPWVRDWLKVLYERELWIKSPPVKARCNTVDYTNFVDKIIGQEYEKWATTADLDLVGYSNDKKRKITWKNGSFVEFMTYEQPVLTHGGAARDIIQHDEESPPGHWAQSKMRVSTTSGRMTIGMTAEQGVTWTEDEIWKPGLTGKDKAVFAVEMTTYDNPKNTQEMVDRIKASCRDEAEIAIRIYGKSAPRGGRVYAMAQDKHPWIIDPFDIPENEGSLTVLIDPHPQLPHAVLWQWVDYKGLFHPLGKNFDGETLPNVYNIAELFESCNPAGLVEMIREIETYRIGRKHDFCLCDPYAWNTDQNNPKTLAQQFEEHGLYPSKAAKDRDAGIILVKEMLSLQIGKDLPEDVGPSRVIRRKYRQLMTFESCK